MTEHNSITMTEMLSAAKKTMRDNGFMEVTACDLKAIDSANYGLFEDAYSLVAIVVCETWSDLFKDWADVQASFVDLISSHFSRDDSKAWDCYLLLWTPDLVPLDKSDDHRAIRYDTGRVRKLISTGAEIRNLADVPLALIPLLPITESISSSTNDDVLDRLPTLLEIKELPKQTIRSAVEAFQQSESLVEAIHQTGGVE